MDQKPAVAMYIPKKIRKRIRTCIKFLILRLQKVLIETQEKFAHTELKLCRIKHKASVFDFFFYKYRAGRLALRKCELEQKKTLVGKCLWMAVEAERALNERRVDVLFSFFTGDMIATIVEESDPLLPGSSDIFGESLLEDLSPFFGESTQGDNPGSSIRAQVRPIGHALEQLLPT